MTKKSRIPIPKLNKVRAELQQEINSMCPFCNNEDVGYFEIHHIDGDATNHVNSNLILLCRNCHSKITMGTITTEKVLAKKHKLDNAQTIEFISVNVDSENCSWRAIAGLSNVFEVNSLKSLFPVLTFTFINHSQKTNIMTNIQIETKRLPVGLSGPYVPLPAILRPTIKYKIKMPEHGKVENTTLIDEIEIPAGRAFKFQVELFRESMEEFKPPNKYVLKFNFGFNGNFIDIPKILLNTSKYYDTLQHYGVA